MKNSNTLPKIEVGDTVIFRTDLVVDKYYGSLSFKRSMIKVVGAPRLVSFVSPCKSWFDIRECGVSFTPEMVAQVIKPTKERVYTEQEMKECWEKAFEQGMNLGDEDYAPVFFKDFIESLNK